MNSDYQIRLAKVEESLHPLPDKPEESPQSTLRALWMTAAGSPMSAQRALGEQLPPLTTSQLAALDELIEGRLSGIPLGHLTGRQMFMDIELVVSREALLPRRETEILARAAVETVSRINGARSNVIMVDTCCGCGNVALAVARKVPGIRVIGVDISAEAVELARLNARNLGLDDRVEFRTGDLFEPISDVAGKVALITCNPPYISSSKVLEMAREISEHEPRIAFDGGPFGVKILRRLIKEVSPVLQSGGHLAFEVGLGQGEPMISLMQKSGLFELREPLRDEDGSIRTIVAFLT